MSKSVTNHSGDFLIMNMRLDISYGNRKQRGFSRVNHRRALPYGRGRSCCGDCPLNDGGILVDTSFLNRIRSYDKKMAKLLVKLV